MYSSDIRIWRPNTRLSKKGICVGGNKKPKYFLTNRSYFLENIEETLDNLFPNFQEVKVCKQ